MTRLHAAGLALCLSVSCAPAASPPLAPAPAPQAPATPATPPAPAPAADEQQAALDAKLGHALAYVSAIRGLAAKTPVKGRLITPDEVERYLTQELDDETPPDVLAATEALLYGFGTVERSFDYRASVIALMKSQLLGFYDPKQKTFFVGGELRGDEADVTLWHELVHALQDQHFDLSSVTDWKPDAGDSQAAVHALAEGDATSTMLDAMLKPRQSTALDVPPGLMRAESVLGSAALSAPPVLVRSLIAPYVDGLAFTNELRRRGGFPAVDQAWRALPASTEQLLHLDKYLAHEAPLLVPLPPPPAAWPELSERFHDVMGEQTLRLLFEEWLPANTASEAASDWGGDRIAVFSDAARKRWAVGWHLRFDSPAAAERAMLALSRSAPLTDLDVMPRPTLGPKRTSGPSAKLCLARHTQGPIALARRGADLAVTLGPFERNSVAVAADPDCPTALAWAQAIATH